MAQLQILSDTKYYNWCSGVTNWMFTKFCPMGCPWWESVVCSFYVAVYRARGAPPPLGVGMFSLVFNSHGVGFVGLLSQKKEKKKSFVQAIDNLPFFLKCKLSSDAQGQELSRRGSNLRLVASTF